MCKLYSEKKEKLKYANHKQIIYMKLMSKSYYLIAPKGIKFTWLGKLRLTGIVSSVNRK